MSNNVALFITCLTDQYYPHVGIAVTRILEHFGCKVYFPQRQTCCGQPLFNNGYHPEAADLARHMIEVFEPYEYVVTPSASCCAMVREHFPELLGLDHAWEHGMHDLVGKTYEFLEFLEQVLHVDFATFKLPRPRTVTYHYSCHNRGIGMRQQPVQFLQRMGNVNYVPMKDMDMCCGFGGTFAVKYPNISGAIVGEKAANIAATGAEVTVCNDAGCTMNISGMCHRQGVQTEFRHIAELIAEALGMDVTRW